MKSYIISYDIQEDKKRRKISKILANYGRRIQYSVFYLNIPEKELYHILMKINPHINKKNDSIIIIPINVKNIEKIGTLKENIFKKEDNFII
ncbi:CRISPR-associated endonuclease Cas2 [Marinitoga sp. 1155]|uniref:CRISPR-associated endonuclease Cas2 n=1 Tax=Marinitoga sp. 1155 TaxID=1428448 RepID=UPI000658C875|nr:CRISPR-associated endonuclease Cas2 [Marinitoga sp. 1155]KLO24724.1 CRISPR-associated protein Cas2 [Marinitoga sp. 1155]